MTLASTVRALFQELLRCAARGGGKEEEVRARVPGDLLLETINTGLKIQATHAP